MKWLSIIISILFASKVGAQSQPKWSFGVTPFKYERNFQTHHKNFEPKVFLNFFAQQEKSPKFTTVYMMEFGQNKLNDQMNDCYDCYSGSLQITEFGVLYGKRINFNLKPESIWRIFLEGDLNYRWTKTNGRYTGGHLGILTKDERFHTVGTIMRLGTRITPFQKFSIETSLYFNQDFGYYENLENKYSEYFFTAYNGGIDLKLVYHL